MPQAPDPIGLPDLAPARTEASPPNVPDIDNLNSKLGTNQIPDDHVGDDADGTSPRPDFGPSAQTSLVTPAHDHLTAQHSTGMPLVGTHIAWRVGRSTRS